jgi:predicted nucleic acid-binding protein
VNGNLPVYILDSFAVLALLEGENSAGRVQAILEMAEQHTAQVYLSLINLGEILYLAERERGLVLAQKTLVAIEQFPLDILPATRERVLAAAHLKAHFPISYADAFAAAAAQEFRGTLVTGDPEFLSTEKLIHIEWLIEQR